MPPSPSDALTAIVLAVASLGFAASPEPASCDPYPAAPSPVGAAADTSCARLAPGLRRVAPDTIAGPDNLLAVAAAQPDSAHVHVVVEIPAGTDHKWEVTKPGGQLALEQVGGAPRRVQYLPYPANYGFVPRTLSDRSAGGDGDPLDVILLGEARPCGAVVRARLLGVLRLTDDGERDDKLLAAAPDSPFASADGVDAVRRQFPGVLAILETWFTRYEDGNASEGVGDAASARDVVRDGASVFARSGDENPPRR
jgi:inorganic pyrophosphatase